jgi:hypothetical protein
MSRLKVNQLEGGIIVIAMSCSKSCTCSYCRRNKDLNTQLKEGVARVWEQAERNYKARKQREKQKRNDYDLTVDLLKLNRGEI